MPEIRRHHRNDWQREGRLEGEFGQARGAGPGGGVQSQIGQRGVGFGVGVGVDGRLFSLFILFGGPGRVGVESCTVLSLWRAARENLGKIGSMPASALINSQK